MSNVVTIKFTVEISQNSVTFLEYLNFMFFLVFALIMDGCFLVALQPKKAVQFNFIFSIIKVVTSKKKDFCILNMHNTLDITNSLITNKKTFESNMKKKQ